jgi:small-conductance mechanosensitive channel
MRFLQQPEIREGLVSLLLLAGSYVAARFVSFLLGLLLEKSARRTASTLDDDLLSALKQPVTYLLFLGGAYLALHRLPGPERVLARLDLLLFVVGVLLVTLALMRTYRILLHWYTTQSRFAEADGLAREFRPMLTRLGQLFLALLAAIAVLHRFGINVQSLVVSLGVGSLAVGLAAQDTLANLFAGFVLMLDRPFRIGERIQLTTGEVGDVETVGMRATRIRTLDDTIVIVPNSLIVKDRLVNQSRPTRHITCRVDVGVAYDTDLEAAKRALVASALAVPLVDAERAPAAVVTKFADFAIQMRLVFYARDYTEQGLAVSAVHQEIARRFAELGIDIPYPTRTVIHEGELPGEGPKA